MSINKKFPNDYSKQYTKIINSMSFTTNPDVVGSMSEKGNLYPSDVDMTETVATKYKNNDTACTYLEKRFKTIIKTLMKLQNVIIGDIKAGCVGNEPVRWKPKQILQGVNDNYKLKSAFADLSAFLHSSLP